MRRNEAIGECGEMSEFREGEIIRLEKVSQVVRVEAALTSYQPTASRDSQEDSLSLRNERDYPRRREGYYCNLSKACSVILIT